MPYITSSQYLETLLDSIDRYSDYQNDFFTIEQLKVYGKKQSIGSPSYLYQTGLDQLFPLNNPSSSQNYINFNGLIQYKSVKQSNTLVTGSWNPDVNIFSNEALATPEYSTWNDEVFNNMHYKNDRYNRLSYVYPARKTPLQYSGSNYNPINYFKSGFWVSIISQNSVINSGAVSVIINKSFFLESKFSDSQRLPLDIAIYTSSTLNSSFNNNWSNINLSYYGALTSVNFTLYSYDSNHFNMVIDLPNSLSNSSYNHFLILVGANTPINNTKSSLSLTGSVGTKCSILKYLSDVYYPTIVLPKTYNTHNITTIINTNNNTYGLTGSLITGNIVLLINQSYTGSNGKYVVNTGPWLKIDSFVPNQFNFLHSDTLALTGSKILYAKNGICFDAIEPQMEVFSYNIDNLNPLAIYNQFSSKPLSNIIFSGSIYDSFKFTNYSFDLKQPIPAAIADVKFGYTDLNIGITNPFITSSSSALCRIPDNTIVEGGILSVTGSYAISSGSVFYLISTPADFAVCKNISNVNNTLQFIAQKVYGNPTQDLKAYSNVIIYSLNASSFTENHNYIKMHEVFECQLFQNLDFSKYGKRGSDDALTINNVNNIAKGSTGLEVKSSAYNPNSVIQLARKYGRRTTGSIFQNFLGLSIKKPFYNVAMEGVIVSPVNNYLSSDLQFTDKIYEYQKQLAAMNGKLTYVSNSLTSPTLGWQEFDFNYLNNQSIAGESSSAYAAINPYFTGPNVITTSDSFSTRVNTIYNYGNKYNIIETTNNIAPQAAYANFSSFTTNNDILGPTILNNTSNFWNGFSGSNGVYLNASLAGLDYPTDPASETNSSLTNHNLYSVSGSYSDLIFSGQTIFIPLPITDYPGSLQSVRVAMKILGKDIVNGFLRAYVADLSQFFLTNDTYSINLLATSDIVTLNYLNTQYQDAYFTFKTDALFASRSIYGQIPYIAIQKIGDISNSLLSVRAINSPTGSFTQSYSGSTLNSNLMFSSVAESTTGSNILSAYEYLGDQISMLSRSTYPFTQSFDVITFPYFDNSSLTVYNSPNDNIPVSYTNSSGSIALNNIPLSTPKGINLYSFSTPSLTGSCNINLGSTAPTSFNTRPIGYHLLVSVTKQNNDGNPNALQELERNFVFDTQMLPEMSLIITNHSRLKIAKNLGPDDSSLINSAKSSILNTNNLIQRKDFQANERLYSFFTPRTVNLNTVDTFAGVRSQQIVDQIFQNNNSQTIIRSRINSTPGMAVTIYQGNANGIPTNLLNSVPIEEFSLITSSVNASTITKYPLLLTVMYINFISGGNESLVRITVGQNSLYRIDNLTSSTTISGVGPTGILSISTTTGTQYNLVGYAFGPYAEQNNIKLEYYDTSFNTFTISSGSKFPGTIQTKYVIHPYGMSLTDVLINETNDTKDDLFRRYIR